MSISVESILGLEVFKNARLLTSSSAKRRIKAVSVSDVVLSDDMIEDQIIREGDFYLSTLSYYSEDESIFENNVKVMIKAKCSGLCITDQHIDQVPNKIIDLCDKEAFPLIIIDKDVPYSLIIRMITESIISSQSHVVNINIINTLLNGNISKSEKNELIKRLNRHFKPCFKVFYINNISDLHESTFIEMINSHKSWLSVPYIDGVLAILTFSESDEVKRNKEFSNLTSFILNQGNIYSDSIIGVSSIHLSLHELNDGIKEAIFAANSAPYTKKKILFYDDLGSIRLLIALQNHQELYNYYHLTIKKVINYDNKYNTSLMQTLEAFVKNDADYKKTSHDTNQHENTVRYQINKIKLILDLENNHIQFLETISLGLKAHNILD